MDKIYLSACSKCRKKTPHRISGLSKKRGVKLRCLRCGNFRHRYTKVDKLVEFEFNKSEASK